MRVNTETLDRFLGTVGEVILNSSQLRTQAALGSDDRRGLSVGLDRMDRVVGELQRRALELRTRAFGRADRRTAETMESLAELLWSLNDRPAARELFDEALAVREELLGPEHPDTLQAINNLAEALRRQGAGGANGPGHANRVRDLDRHFARNARCRYFDRNVRCRYFVSGGARRLERIRPANPATSATRAIAPTF